MVDSKSEFSDRDVSEGAQVDLRSSLASEFLEETQHGGRVLAGRHAMAIIVETVVLSVRCARYATTSSNAWVKPEPAAAQGTISVVTPHRGHSTRHVSYSSVTARPQTSRCRHSRRRRS